MTKLKKIVLFISIYIFLCVILFFFSVWIIPFWTDSLILRKFFTVISFFTPVLILYGDGETEFLSTQGFNLFFIFTNLLNTYIVYKIGLWWHFKKSALSQKINLKPNKKRLWRWIILITITVAITVIVFYVYLSKLLVIDTPLITPLTFQDFGISQTYIYHDFTFPFPLPEKEVTDSLMNKSIIVVDNLTKNQIDALAGSVFSTKWKQFGYDFPGDGMRVKYWKSDEKPAVEIFYKREEGSVEIKFIHPKDIPSWR